MGAYDNALFLRPDAIGNLMGILTMHVDNLIFCELLNKYGIKLYMYSVCSHRQIP